MSSVLIFFVYLIQRILFTKYAHQPIQECHQTIDPTSSTNTIGWWHGYILSPIPPIHPQEKDVIEDVQPPHHYSKH